MVEGENRLPCVLSLQEPKKKIRVILKRALEVTNSSKTDDISLLKPLTQPADRAGTEVLFVFTCSSQKTSRRNPKEKCCDYQLFSSNLNNGRVWKCKYFTTRGFLFCSRDHPEKTSKIAYFSRKINVAQLHGPSQHG